MSELTFVSAPSHYGEEYNITVSKNAKMLLFLEWVSLMKFKGRMTNRNENTTSPDGSKVHSIWAPEAQNEKTKMDITKDYCNSLLAIH